VKLEEYYMKQTIKLKELYIEVQNYLKEIKRKNTDYHFLGKDY
jgi:hypothetical protein